MRLRQSGIGFICGVIVSTSISALANDFFEIVPNPFKIKIDGETAQIEGYNINGNSYFKLRDIGEKVGFDVDFKNEVININTLSTNEKNNVIVEEKEFYPYFSKHVNHAIQSIEFNGEKYISSWHVWAFPQLTSDFDTGNNIYSAYKGATTENGRGLYIAKKTGEAITDTVPTYQCNPYNQDAYYIKYDDFLTKIKPVIDKILDENNIPKGSLDDLEFVKVD